MGRILLMQRDFRFRSGSKARGIWGISFSLEGRYEHHSGEVVVILKEGFEINCTRLGPRHLNVAFLAEKERVLPLQDRTGVPPC